MLKILKLRGVALFLKIQATPWKNGRSSGLKWRTSNHIPIEPASKKSHFKEIKTIVSRRLKKNIQHFVFYHNFPINSSKCYFQFDMKNLF